MADLCCDHACDSGNVPRGRRDGQVPMLARLAGATARGVAGPRGACAAVRRIKTTTGVVGLEVEPEAKSVLEGLYAKTLTALEAFPADAEYRSVSEAMTKERLAVVQGTSDLAKIEASIGAGQARRAAPSPSTTAPPRRSPPPSPTQRMTGVGPGGAGRAADRAGAGRA